MAAARKRPGPQSQPALLEWSAAGLGLVLIVAALGVILVEAFAPRTPADIAVRPGAIAPVDAGWRVEVEAVNRGRLTAAEVVIEGELAGETAQAIIPYVPGRGRERATLTFRADPRAGGLEVRARGWTEP